MLKTSGLLLALSVLSLTCCTQSLPLEEQAQEKIAVLSALVLKAESKGISTERERMTLRTAEIFLKYADWDEANIPVNQDHFRIAPGFKEEADKLGSELPDFERNEVLKILDDAIIRLELIIKGKYTRKNFPPIDWSRIEIAGNTLIQDGRPIFLADHFWRPSIDELEEFYGALDAVSISPRMVLNDKGEIDPRTIERLKEKAENNLGSLYIDNNGIPEWARAKYDNIGAGAGVFGKYDIDHPGTREIYRQLYKNTIPIVAGKKYTSLGYEMFNEPCFFTQTGVWNTRAVSDYTKDKFKVWLNDKHGSISKLNSLWGTEFKGFKHVTITIPIESALQGTPMWYDWMDFNNYRVTDWFRFVKGEITRHDPAAKVQIKLMPWLWTEAKRDHGMDFESLIRLCGICGCDAMARNSNVRDEHEFWMDKYSFLWTEISLMFDFFRSVQPDQIIYDTETHILSSVHFRDLYMTPEYVRATYWLAHLHGLNLSRSWAWGREPSGEISRRMNNSKHYAVTITQQPAALNELHATIMDLNRFSEEITAIQLQKKPLRIYYSLANSISRKDYMDDVFATYESIYFDGIQLGFATDSILILDDHSNWEAVLVRETEIVTLQEFNTLQAYLNNGGTVIIDEQSFKRNEYGEAHPELKPGSGTLLAASSLSEMKNKSMDILSGKGLLPEVRVTETKPSGDKTCMWRCIKNKEGKNVLSVVNIGNTESSVQIELTGSSKGTICKDLINGIQVSSSPVLKPDEVYFVEVSSK